MMMRRGAYLLFATAVFAVGATAPVFANQDGTTTATFLRIGQGARAEGMGGAFTAVADDANAVYWNPAGLAQITRKSATITHVEFIEEVNSQFAAFVLPVDKLHGSLGFGLTYIDLGKIDKTEDLGGNPSDKGTADVNSYAGTVSWGQALGERLALGVSMKFINQDLAGETGSGFAADLGGLVALVPERLMLGISALNVGPKLKTGQSKEDLPQTVSGGLAFTAVPRKLLLTLDAEKEKATDPRLKLGGEYTFQDRYIIRAGYQDTFDAGGGISAGLGYVWRPRSDSTTDFFGQFDNKKESQQEGLDVRIDYAYVDMGDFDATHRIGLHLAF